MYFAKGATLTAEGFEGAAESNNWKFEETLFPGALSPE